MGLPGTDKITPDPVGEKPSPPMFLQRPLLAKLSIGKLPKENERTPLYFGKAAKDA